MIDRNVLMMDAGTRLFETEKPYGNVLGGIKTEMGRHGKVIRKNEAGPETLPEGTEGCDLFLDRSTPLKSRYISCTLEDAGTVGKTEDGEDIHRYAASLKEGNRTTRAGKSVSLAIVVVWGLLGWLFSDGKSLVFITFLTIGILAAWLLIRPDRKSTRIIEQLLDDFHNAK